MFNLKLTIGGIIWILIPLFLFSQKTNVLDRFTTLAEEADRLVATRNWDSALVYYDEAFVIWQDAIASSDKDSTLWDRYFESREKQGVAFYNTDRRKKSKAVFIKLIDEIRARFGNQHPRLGNAFFYRGASVHVPDSPSVSIHFFRESLKIKRIYFAEDDSLMIPVLARIGEAYRVKGQLDSAIHFASQAFDLNQKYPSPHELKILVTLSNSWKRWRSTKKHLNTICRRLKSWKGKMMRSMVCIWPV
jgi:tetratricopeptide (TPR) repeat protein